MVCSKMEVPVTLKEQIQFLIIFVSWTYYINLSLLREIWKVLSVAKCGQLHSSGQVRELFL